MPITKVGIVYSKNQQVIRRIIHFDRIVEDGRWRLMTPGEVEAFNEKDHLAIHQKACHPAEHFATIPHADYHALESHQEIHDHLGLKGVPGVTDRHAVVDDGGKVLAVVHADPAIDVHPAGKLISHATIVAGEIIAP